MIGLGYFKKPRKYYSTSTTTAEYDEPTDSWEFGDGYETRTSVSYGLSAPPEPPEEEPKKPIQKNRVFFLKSVRIAFPSIFKPGPGWGFFRGSFS